MKSFQKEKTKKLKILVVLGPTASGKTALAVSLARRFNGEIVSADSRQVYKGMDIGSGKDLQEYGRGANKIPYHLIDVVSPEEDFNVAKYQKLAKEAIEDIAGRNKLPILTGGTGLYLQSIIDGFRLFPKQPDLDKRRELEAKSVSELYHLLEKIKPDFAIKLNNSDRNNPRRLIRYLEIISSGGSLEKPKADKRMDFLILGLRQDDNLMRKRILKRIIVRLEKQDMIGEVSRLLDEGVSSKKLISLGLEYRFITWYLEDKLSYDEMIEKLLLASYRFAKRQKTWFKRLEKQGRKINWLEGDVKKEAEKLVNAWLKK